MAKDLPICIFMPFSYSIIMASISKKRFNSGFNDAISVLIFFLAMIFLIFRRDCLGQEDTKEFRQIAVE